MGHLPSYVENFFKSVAPVDSVTSAGHNITIHAHASSMVAVNGNNNANIKPWVLCAILGFVIVCLLIMTANMRITNSQAEEFANLVKTVAECEDTTPNKIHNEIRKAQGYDSYKNMNQIGYFSTKQKLSSRICE